MIRKITFLSTLTATALLATTEVDPKIFNDSPEIAKKVKILKAIDLGDIYQVRGIPKTNANAMGAYNMFITKDKKYIIFGEGYNLQTNEKVEIPIDMSSYKDKAAFTFGSGKDEYFVFTDPECPFCAKFEDAMEKMGKDATFHVFLFPLTFHKHAKDMSLYVLSQPKDKRHEALKDIMLNHSKAYENFKPSKDVNSTLQANMQVAQELSVGGTPTVFGNKGQKINWTDLVKKYKIQTDVDKRAIDFLKRNKIAIKLNDGNKEDVFVFLDLEKNADYVLGKEFKKLLSKYNVNVVLYPKDSQDGLAKALFVYNSSEPKQAFFEYAKKELTADDRKKSAELLKDKTVNKKVMTGLFVSERANIIKMPLVVNTNGKIINLVYFATNI